MIPNPRAHLIMQQTLILLKPDCVHRRLVAAVLQRFEQKGLRLAALKLVQASRATAEKHYAVHKGKPFYDSLLQFLTAGATPSPLFYGPGGGGAARHPLVPSDGGPAPPRPPPRAFVPGILQKHLP